jgi:hypothetical protein
MKVSQIKELDTHVVIGGGESQAFGMSDSAEFFTVLSDTLYRDKMLAVVRETVCNAYDAHIMAKKTDVPVEITLTEAELIIKDFGPGITDDRMLPIFCIYGASTKVADATQTGGFGLGSKAPFAYTDHFTVVSCHNGVKNVYAISRGGVASDGKPELRKIVTVPTDETGLMVTIPLRKADDFRSFEKLLYKVVRQGGMLANFNGKPMPRLDYTTARKQGYGVLVDDQLTESTTYVLYGTVLYPLSTTDKDIVKKVLELANTVEKGAVTILIAPPNSLGVTPSREALSYSDKTTATIHELLDRAIGDVQRERRRYLSPVIKDLVDKMVRFAPRLDLSSINGRSYSITSDRESIAKRAVLSRLSNFSTPHQRTLLVLKHFAAKYREERREARRLRGLLKAQPYYDTSHAIGQFAFKTSRKKFIRLGTSLGMLEDIFIHARYDRMASIMRFNGNKSVIAQKLLLSPNQKDAQTHLNNNWRLYHGNDLGYDLNARHAVLIVRKPSPELFDKIEAECKRFGIEVSRLPFPEKKPRAPAKKLEAYFDITQITGNGRNAFKFTGEPKITKPKFFLKFWGTQTEIRIPSGFDTRLRFLSEKYGEIAIINNAGQEPRLIKMGARNLIAVLLEEYKELIEARDVQYRFMISTESFFIGSTHHYDAARAVAKLIKMSDTIAKMIFPEKAPITPRVTKARALKMLFEACSLREQGISFDAEAKALIEDLRLKATTTYKHMRMSPSEATKRFAYLEVLSGLYNVEVRDVDTLIEVIRFLQRRSKSKLTDQPLKEAA